MTAGLDKFREHFRAYKDRYVLIGGIASMINMEQLGEEFRATKDFDMVLFVEAIDAGFVSAFWEFVRLGGYGSQETGERGRQFYRFKKPTDPSFPSMIELFARKPDVITLAEGQHLTRIPVSEEVSSLSAILLDDAYYNFIQSSKVEVDGISIVEAFCLIPLKTKAFLDLSRRKAEGQNIDERDIRKHRNDVLRLHSILKIPAGFVLDESIKADLREGFQKIKAERVDFKALKIPGESHHTIIDDLWTKYGLN